MASSVPSINLIVAACEGFGIGYKGQLPWKLSNELKYFSRLTRTTIQPNKQNAVVMGRKTWFSIPEKNRPLPARINVVLSRELNDAPKGADFLARSLDEAFNQLSSSKMEGKIDKIWIIGGSSIYELAMKSQLCHRIYLTRILAKFDCDTFFPEIDQRIFKEIIDLDVPSELQEEENIQYKYEVYEKL